MVIVTISWPGGCCESKIRFRPNDSDVIHKIPDIGQVRVEHLTRIRAPVIARHSIPVKGGIQNARTLYTGFICFALTSFLFLKNFVDTNLMGHVADAQVLGMDEAISQLKACS